MTTRRSRVLHELKPMAALVGSEAGARLLSFCFYIAAARELAPAGFGVLRYTLALSLLAFGALQVLAVAVNRELGASRGDASRTSELLGTAAIAAMVLFVASALLCVAAGALGLTGSADVLGLVVVLAGRAVFELYYAIARGLGHTGRAVRTYVGSSLTQLAAFLILAFLTDPDARVALLVMGATSVLPVLLYERRHPVLLGRGVVARRDALDRIREIGMPLLAAQVGFLVWNSADQIWVERTLGVTEIGYYGAAKTVSQLFVVLPFGVAGALLPRVAQLRTAGDQPGALRALRVALALVVGTSLAAGAVTVLLREPILRIVFGAEFTPASESLAGLAVGMVAYSAFATLTTAAVGWGRASVYTAGIGVAAVAELALLPALDSDAPASAAWAFAGAMGAALVFVLLLLRLRPLTMATAPDATGPGAGSPD